MKDQVKAVLEADTGSCRLSLPHPFTENSRVAFHNAIDTHGREASSWIVDLSSVRFIDSSGLGLLVLLKEQADKADQSITLLNPGRQVLEALRLANFHRIFDISYSTSA